MALGGKLFVFSELLIAGAKVILLWLVSSGLSAEHLYDEHCTTGLENMTLALNIKDWEGLEAVSKKHIASCPKDAGSGYEFLVISLSNRGLFSQAQGYADKCLNFEYHNLGCRLEKSIALIGMGSHEEAVISLNILEKMIPIVKERKNREFASIGSSSRAVERRKAALLNISIIEETVSSLKEKLAQ